MAEGAKPPDAVGNRKNMRREPFRVGAYEVQPKKEPLTFQSPFNEIAEPDLYLAHKKALEILHANRPEIPTQQSISDTLTDAEKKEAEKRRVELEFDTAENKRLTHVFTYQNKIRAREMPDVAKKEARSQAFSQIFEAMLFTGGKKLFGPNATVLPTEYSDRKNATDVILHLGKDAHNKEILLAIDAATEQDLEGYLQSDGTTKGGLEKKMMRSYQNIASNSGKMTVVKYGGTATKNVRDYPHMPHVIVGLSQETISTLAAGWAKDPDAFDPAQHNTFHHIKRSVAAQLISQVTLAREEQRKNKSYKRHAELDSITRTLGAFKAKDLATDIDRKSIVATHEIHDSVLFKIHKATTNKNTRQRLIREAKQAQAQQESGFIAAAQERPKNSDGIPHTPYTMPLDTPLTPLEQKKLDEHFEKNVLEEDKTEAKKALDAFLVGTSNTFPPALLDAVAGGVPTRVFMRLTRASSEGIHNAVVDTPVAGASATELSKTIPHPDAEKITTYIHKNYPKEQHKDLLQSVTDFFTNPATIVPATLTTVAAILAGAGLYYLYDGVTSSQEGAQKSDGVHNDTISAKKDIKEPAQKASRGPHAALPFENIVPIGGGKSEHVAQLPIASLGAHMAAVGKLRESLKGNPFEKKSTRWWSRMKNFALHKLTSVFGVGTGLLAKWVVCGLGAGTLGALGAGIMAGGLAAFGAWKYLKKKKWYDDPWARERAGATQALFNDISNNPATLGYLLTNEAARNAEIERRTKRRIRVGQATLALTNAATAGAALHVATGGEFFPAALRDVRAGTLNNTLSLFACNEPGWFSQSTSVTGGGYEVPQPSGGGAQGGETFIPLTEESPTTRPVATAQYETIEPKNPWDSANRYDPANSWAEWQKRQIPAASYDCHMRACDAQLRLDNIQSRPDATGQWRLTDQLDPYGGRWRPEDMDMNGGYYRDANGNIQVLGNNQVRSYTWDLGR